MKHTLKKSLAIILAAATILCCAPLSGIADLDLPEFGGFKKLASSVSDFFDGFAPKAEAATSGKCGDNLTWTFDESTGTLTISGTGDMTHWSGFNDVPWYSYRTLIKSVSINDSVTSIGYAAFDGCTSLTSVTISNSVTSIGSYAFYNCTSLTNITIPDSVTSIGYHAFVYCESLTSITIPDSVTSIGFGAFVYCTSLTSVTIPDSVTSIGSDAFSGCTSLTSITIPDSVTSIGSGAFYNCTNLTSVTIGNGVTSIGYEAFEDCDSLTNVYYTGTEEEWNAISIGSYNSDLINATFHFNYEAEKLSTEEIIETYVENKDVWMEEKDVNLYERQLYGFVDFDGDGILELVSSRTEGSAGATYNRYFKVDISNNSVYELISHDGIDWPSANLLKNSEGELSYLGQDIMRDSSANMEIFTIYNSLQFSNNELTNTNVFYIHYTSAYDYYNKTGEDIYEYNYHDNGEWIKVSKEEYNNRYNEFMSNYTDLNAIYDFRYLSSEAVNSDDNELKTVITEMYNGFSYDDVNTKGLSTEEIIDIYVQNKDVWIQNENGAGVFNYAFIDVNGDGVLEMHCWFTGGSAYNTLSYFYGIKERSLFEIDNSDEWHTLGEACFDELSLLKHESTGEIVILGKNYEKGYFYNSRNYGLLKYDNGVLKLTHFFRDSFVHPDAEGNETGAAIREYSYNINGTTFIATEEEYYNCYNEFMSNYTDINAVFDSRQLSESQKSNDSELKTVLTEMYNGFSYDDVNEKSIAVFSTERSLCVENGESIWLAFGLVENGELAENWRKMAVTVSDNSIISLSEYKETEYGYSLEIYGKNIGSTHVSITDTASGATTVIVINVRDSYISTSSYAIDNVPKFFPNSITESDIETNIYNMNGLYVNKYNCQKNGDLYNVSFDIYNERYHTGAVDVFDSNGKWLGSEEIEKYSDISSLWDTGEQLVYMVYDFVTCKMLTYQQAASSKYTHIDIKVPEGGYFTISNNFAESVGTFMFNGCEILYEGVSAIIDLAVKGIDSHEFTKLITGKIKDNPKIRDEIFEIFIESIDDEIRKYTKNILDGNINDAYSDISGLFENMLNSAGFNWRHLAEFGVGVTEEILEKLFGPAGLALKGCFSITKGTNKFLQAIHIARSVDKTYATIYSSIDEGYINSNGIIVNTNGSIDTEAVLQVFRVSNNNSVEEILDSSNKLEKYELYNICFVKDDTLVQPNGKVTVYVPIPKGMKGNTCKIYRQEANGNWTVLDAHIEENHLVFETDHFSLYAVIGESGGVSLKSPPVKLEYEIGEVLDVSGLILNVNGEEVTSGFICDPTAFAETGNQKITVKYGCSTTEFYVNIKEKPHFHSYTSSITTPVTCETVGVLTYTCTECGDSYTETIPATGHTQGSWVTSIAPSCTDAGEKVAHCTVCGQICANDIIPATGHIKSSWITTKAATCTAEGERVRKCVYCGEVMETEKTPITVHTPGNWSVSVNPTCTEKGEKVRRCTDCGILLEAVEIPMLSHTPGSWITVLEPTTTTEGKMVRKCTACGVMLEEKTIPVIEDDITVEIRTPSITTIKYGDSIILHAEVDGVMPAGYTLNWTASNGNFSVEPNGDTCKITPVTSGDTTVTLILADENGTPVDSAKQTMTSKAGFFDKIIAFFKKLFGLNKTYPSIFIGISD